MSEQQELPRRPGTATSFKATNPLIHKLSRVVDLSDDDRTALQGMCDNARRIDARRDIIREGDRPDSVHLILDGWASRYKVLKNGKKQVTALLLPGDVCDLHVSVLDRMDHAIGAISRTTFAYVDRTQFDELTRLRPAITRALWWVTLVDEGILRSWIVSLGVRNAKERVAHLICELHTRMKNIGLVEGEQFSLPLTQVDLGEALGLTSVHVNRVVRELRLQGAVQIHRGMATILDLALLQNIADFDPVYLHVQQVDRSG